MPSSKRHAKPSTKEKSSSRHVTPNKNYKYSSLVLDISSRTRLEDRFTASNKLADGEALTPQDKAQLNANISKHISYNSIDDASIISKHWEAVRAYIHNGDTSKLEHLVSEHGDAEGRIIVRYGKDEKKRIILETNLRRLKAYSDYNLFEEGQELDLWQVMSSNWLDTK